MDKENRPVTTTSYKKEIANTAKIYTEEQKYNGIPLVQVLALKFQFFKEIPKVLTSFSK